jgi:CRISPR-associated protein Cmr6
MTCCREVVAALDRNKCANPGLLLARYLRVPVNQEGDAHVRERKELFECAAAALRRVEGTTVYRQAFERRRRWIASSTAHTISGDFETRGRMVIGLGGENVLETGLILDRTYGAPIIPGCALKGLAAHYCSQIWGECDPGFSISTPKGSSKQAGEFARILFGDTEEAGFITFHDAWFTPESIMRQGCGLHHDVMTPHHGDYYSSADSAPTDFDDPTPVLFLSITGRFNVAISCSDTSEGGGEWAELAFRILTEALENYGIGGKTSSGYGRMKRIGTASIAKGDGNASCESASATKTLEVTMEGTNKKGNPQFRVKGSDIRCTLPAGEVVEPEMKKGETRTFWLVEERRGPEYVITSKKPT